jgi:hypothetical protein
LHYHVPGKLHADLREPVIVHSAELPWTPSPQPGVERRFLERDGGEIARATSIVRYAAGSAFPAHEHHKGEEYLVLAGVFSDEHGDFSEGTYVRNPPTSRHAPFTKDGCTIFVKLRQMSDEDRDAVVTRPNEVASACTETPGLARVELYRRRGEHVAIERLASGFEWRSRGGLGGEEILVIEGELLYGDDVCEPGTWIRFPHGRERPLASRGGCSLWTKRGHLQNG